MTEIPHQIPDYANLTDVDYEWYFMVCPSQKKIRSIGPIVKVPMWDSEIRNMYVRPADSDSINGAIIGLLNGLDEMNSGVFLFDRWQMQCLYDIHFSHHGKTIFCNWDIYGYFSTVVHKWLQQRHTSVMNTWNKEVVDHITAIMEGKAVHNEISGFTNLIWNIQQIMLDKTPPPKKLPHFNSMDIEQTVII